MRGTTIIDGEVVAHCHPEYHGYPVGSTAYELHTGRWMSDQTLNFWMRWLRAIREGVI